MFSQKLKAPAPGQPPSEMTRLKALWRKMSEDEQAEWFALFESHASRTDICRQIQARLHVELEHDLQVTPPTPLARGASRFWGSQPQFSLQSALDGSSLTAPLPPDHLILPVTNQNRKPQLTTHNNMRSVC
jgi:hypothetical protein